jgi:hypothetical protein
MGYADAGFNDYKDIPTLHLDCMAKIGIWFSACYVTAPQCAPSRTGFSMGVDQNRNGCRNNNVIDIAGLSETAMIADPMRAEGYRTGMVGKWHLGIKPSQQPMDRRFDEYLASCAAAVGERLQKAHDNWVASMPVLYPCVSSDKVFDFTKAKQTGRAKASEKSK